MKITVQSSMMDRPRVLTIEKDFIEFDDSDRISQPMTKLSKDEITAIRYGVKWIQGYQFVIGRIYCIDIQDKNQQIIKIRLKSIYGVRKTQLSEKFKSIINALYENIFDDLISQYLSSFDDNVDFELSGIVFSQQGIALRPGEDFVPWENLETSAHQTYYTIYPKSNPGSYKAFEFLNDWNATIVYSVSRQILKRKGLYTE